jgi:hypothetical protein
MKYKFKAARQHLIPPFNRAACTNPPHFARVSDDGSPCRYVVGWFFVCSYMIGLRRHMIPVSALDAAHMRHPAQGTVYVEVTKDLLDRLHNVSTFVFLGAENLPGYEVNTLQQLAAYGSSENLDPAGSGGVVLGDAAASLRSQFQPRTTTGGQQTCVLLVKQSIKPAPCIGNEP